MIWHGLNCKKQADEVQLYLNFCVYTHTATTNMAVEEKQLVKSKQNRGKTDGKQGSIFTSLSLECTTPGMRVHFNNWCVYFII